MITIQIDSQALSVILLKALIKYINMQTDWPLRSLIIYRKLGRIMGRFISVSVGLNCGMLLTKISNQRIVFAVKSFYQNLSSPNIDWCTLFAADCERSCFFCFASLFIRLCICLSITA